MPQLFTLAALLLIAGTGQAHAYVDPGLGSILLQSLVAIIAAASVTLGVFWERVKSFFRTKDEPSESAEKRVEDRG